MAADTFNMEHRFNNHFHIFADTSFIYAQSIVLVSMSAKKAKKELDTYNSITLLIHAMCVCLHTSERTNERNIYSRTHASSIDYVNCSLERCLFMCICILSVCVYECILFSHTLCEQQ